ncbi:uncharacterized protein LOC110061929 [Orbicella faveolata]|uniref:uncharacterized protein LOC110061929 n=1 Tax=Orbicella faveolata TaxID=48498 RepID=UPI0009E4E492|nr:uncharacterized protein LOC110061929 [Orbicella faveolata]
MGINYVEILAFLVMCHGICLSMSQLKRILRERGISRRKQQSSVNQIIDAVENELRGSGRLFGYRLMHQKICCSYGVVADRETVRVALQALDPEGVARRSHKRLIRRKYHANGPNCIWHIDGYDKLKPFGFCIHGAIDGYSRRIMWLEVDHSNNNPCIIAKYFLQTVRYIRGTPRIVRGDCGTENCQVAAIQRFFREGYDDVFAGDKSFMYGRSVANQQIEAWWSILRKMNTDFWINYFKDLRETGLYNDDNIVHVQCVKFCFMPLIREELHHVAELWNFHKIRPQPSNRDSPSGRPDILYFLPALNGKVSYIHDVTLDDVELAEEMYCAQNAMDSSFEVFEELAEMIIADENLQAPSNPDEALELCLNLLDHFEDII